MHQSRRGIVARIGSIGLAVLFLAGTLALIGRADDTPLDDDPVPAEAEEEVEAEEVEPEEEPAAEDEADGAAEAEADDGEGGEKAQEKPRNPVGRFFGRLFDREKGERILPEEREDVVRDNRDRARDNIDLRAPQKPEQTKRLRRAERLVDEEDWPRAYEYLEAILGLREATNKPPEDTLVRTADGQWVSIRWEANRMMGRLPEELLRTHELDHGPEASTRFREARDAGDLAGIAEVATRYFHTVAGRQAANLLGGLYYERGEYGLAARWYGRLVDAESAFTNDPIWRLRAAQSFARAGQSERVEAMTGRIRDDGGLRRIRVAGDVVDLEDWIAGLGERRRELLVPALSNWLAPYGNARRIGTQVSAEPLLVPRWTEADEAVDDASRKVGGQLRWLMRDLRDSGLPAVPSIQPIAIDGKIVYRSLGAVTVVDAETGERLWETDRGVSPLALLGAETVEGTTNVQTHVGAYQGNNPDGHPLTTLIVRNGLWGTVTSDGERIFVVEDEPALLHNNRHEHRWRGGGIRAAGIQTFGQRTLDFGSNRLTAYDLDSGRPVWSVGGRRSDEPFAPPLEGYRFFCPPVADGGELFGVAERDDEIRLVVIDAETGGENWSQLVALPDVDIDDDSHRRAFSAQVAVGQGIVVCPTTVGWLVAVDRLNHSVLWAHRYSKPPTDGSSRTGFHVDEMNSTDFRSLGQRWSPSAPIIVGNRVLYTPEEEAALYCFDLFDGRELWERTMGGHMYVAGVHGDHVIVVGQDAIEAISVEYGRPIWSIDVSEGANSTEVETRRLRVGPDGTVVDQPFGEPDFPMPMDMPPTFQGGVLPSGRGVMIGDHYHVPMTSGELWKIDLRSGDIVARSFLPDGALPLGNLLTHRDALYSASALGLRAFEARPAFDAELARHADEPNAAAALKLAGLHLGNRQYHDALEALHRIPLEDVPAEQRAAYREATIRALVEVVRSNPGTTDKEIAELGRIVKSPAENVEFRRVQADRLIAIEDLPEAFEAYLALVDEPSDEFVDVADTGVRVRADDWLAGCLLDTWKLLDDESRKRFDVAIEERGATALAGSDAQLRRHLGLFGFHPSSDRLEAAYVGRIEGKAPFAIVESRIRRRLLTSDDPEIVAGAEEVLKRLQQHYGLAEGEPRAPFDDWGDIDAQLVQTRDYSSNETTYPVTLRPARSPFFDRHRFVVHQQQNYFGGGSQIRRLEVVDVESGQRHWMPSLRSRNDNSHVHGVGLTDGHLVFLAYHDVLNVLSPVDRRVVWTREMGNQAQLSTFYRHSTVDHAGDVQMHSGPRIVAQTGVTARAARQGLLAAANANYVCFHTRRGLVVHDTETGVQRWSLGDLQPNIAVYGSEQALFVGSGSRIRVFRPLDGKLLDRPKLAELAVRSLLLDDEGVVLVENRAKGGLGLFGVQTVVGRYPTGIDEDSSKPVWERTFDRNTGLVRIDEDHLLALAKDGELSVLDLRTGEGTTYEKVPEEILKGRANVSALSDGSRIYVFVGTTANRRRLNFIADDEIPHVRFDGWVVAFDRRTRELAWKREVNGQALLLPYFADSPFVVFASRQYVQESDLSFWIAKAIILDKRTGRVLYDDTVPSNNGFQSIHVDVARRFVELRAYNGRSIFHAVPRKDTNDADDATTKTSADRADDSPSDEDDDAAEAAEVDQNSRAVQVEVQKRALEEKLERLDGFDVAPAPEPEVVIEE